MNKFINHYENLNVSQDADLASIRASYHSLCKIFHPDLNPGMQDGLQMIEELTKSYEILKDSDLRQDYDLKYLIEMRRTVARQGPVAAPVTPALPELPTAAIKREPIVRIETVREERKAEYMDIQGRIDMNEDKSSKNGLFLKVASFTIVGLSLLGFALNAKMPSNLGLINPLEMISSAKYVRSAMAPNGKAFPETSAYLEGYDLRNNDGTSSLYVTNSRNDNDVYLKLLSLEQDKVLTVRHVFIKAKTDFKIENLSNGKYEVQYLDLSAGKVGKSEIFTVNETQSAIGMNSVNLGINLRTAVNGVLKVKDVSIDEFNSLASM